MLRPRSQTYLVEISGWDIGQDFFVEKTTLEWSEESEKSIYLRHAIREGAIVFVRLLDCYSGSHNIPVAYQAEKVLSGDTQGVIRITLAQLHASRSSAMEHSSAGDSRPPAWV